MTVSTPSKLKSYRRVSQRRFQYLSVGGGLLAGLVALLFAIVGSRHCQAATAVTYNVSESVSDAMEFNGKMYVTSYPYLILGYPNSYIGLRFTGNSIPKGAIIQSAYLELTSSHALSTIPCDAAIQGIAQENPDAFASSSKDISSRPRTAASVSWALADTLAGAVLQSPDLASVIQELINRPGYAAGQSLALVIVPGTGSNYRLAWQYDGQPTSAARLHVTYTMSATMPDPIVHWTFDESSGNAINLGTLGSAADATLSGSVDRGAMGLYEPSDAFRFDGGQVTPGNVTRLNRSGPWDKRSVSLWFRADSTTNRQVLYCEGGTTREFLVYLEGGRVYVAAENRANDDGAGAAAPWGGPPVFISSSEMVEPGRTYHVIAVLDGSISGVTGELRGYLNGEEFASTTGIGGFWAHNQARVGRSPKLRFHDNRIGSGFPFFGVIDDVRIYNVALSDYHAAELYGLVAHWKLDETAGNTAADDSPNDNEARMVKGAPEWTPGVRGGALQFSRGDRLDAGAIAVSGKKISLATWVYVDGKTKNAPLIINSEGNGKRNQGWGLSANDNGNVEFGVHAGGGWDQVEAVEAIEQGVWSHLVGTYDGKMMRLYVNAVLVQARSHAVGGALDASPSHIVTIGDSITGNGVFHGLLDDVRVYSRPLTSAQIAELFGLMAHWKLDEGSGTTVKDSSGTGNHGTHSGGVSVYAFGPYPGGGDASAEYDGVNDYTELPDLSWDFSDGFATAFWFRPQSRPTGSYGLLGASNGHKVDDIEVTWQAGSGIVMSFSHTVDGGAQTVLCDNKDPEVHQWQHCIVSVDSTGNGTIYRDGVAVARGVVSLPNKATRTENYIGKTVGNGAFAGRMFDVRLYNRTILPNEVEEIYGLVGHWRLDESSGTIAADSTSRANDGEYQRGPLLDQKGRVGTAVRFDGDNDRVEIESTRSFSSHMTSGHSVAAWVKVLAVDTDSHGQRRQPILAKGLQSPGEWALYVYDSGAAGLSTWQNGGAPHSEVSGGSIPIGVWKHVAGVYVPGDSTRLYVDGIEVNADTKFDGVITRGGYPVLIGARQDHQYLKAVVDDVRLYNRPISRDEVDRLYQSGKPRGVRIIRWVEVR